MAAGHRRAYPGPHARVRRMWMSKVAVIQSAGVPFDADAGTERAAGLIAEAASGGATLAVFPEAFIGGYPKCAPIGAAVGFPPPRGGGERARSRAGDVPM